MIALLAALFERCCGYSPRLVAVIGHPVMWAGWLIGALDTRLNRTEYGFGLRRAAGVLALAIVLAITLIAAVLIANALRNLPFGRVLEIVIASTLIAQKGLRDAVKSVETALVSGTLDDARHAVAQIVGRDTAQLDEAEISRAAIETLAENTSDGVIAPLFYLVILGLPGIALYKAINTADSMIGHRSERHLAFGWAAARLDDVVNFLPARLTALLFAGAARLLPGADARAAWATARRDAGKHASPNAGWPEAALAGALGLGLGGPRAYHGQQLMLPQMGDGRRDLRAADIAAALALYDRLLVVTWAILALAAMLGL